MTIKYQAIKSVSCGGVGCFVKGTVLCSANGDVNATYRYTQNYNDDAKRTGCVCIAEVQQVEK